MDGGKLARRLGLLLRLERQRRSLSQAAVAERAGVAQQAVSRFESGGTAATCAVVERLFEAIGCQLRLETEPIDADLDGAMERAVDGRGRMIPAHSAAETICHGVGYSIDGVPTTRMMFQTL